MRPARPLDFLLIALLAAIDGLTERDIRKACGGNESAMRYHRKTLYISIHCIGLWILFNRALHGTPALVFFTDYVDHRPNHLRGHVNVQKFL